MVTVLLATTLVLVGSTQGAQGSLITKLCSYQHWYNEPGHARRCQAAVAGGEPSTTTTTTTSTTTTTTEPPTTTTTTEPPTDDHDHDDRNSAV